MGAFINAGGSLTLSVAALVVIWTFRTIRNRKQQRPPAVVTYTSYGKHHCSLSPSAVRLLASIDPIPHYIIDIRPPEDAVAAPLPPSLAAAIQIQGDQLQAALTSPAAWQAVAGGRPPPSYSHLLVFISEEEDAAQQAAGLAAAHGYQRTAVIPGGAGALAAAPAVGLAGQQPRHLRHIHRDALALLLGAAARPAGLQLPSFCLLDVRRHDERALYGAVQGALHVPVEELAAALAGPAEAFQARYREAPPPLDQPLVLLSRTNQRALWAAQLAQDAGWSRVYLYKQGTNGWRLSPHVKPYAKYQLWEAPPEPEPFTVEVPDLATGLQNLNELGLLLREG